MGIVRSVSRRGLRGVEIAAQRIRKPYAPPVVALNVGTGGHDREGWINVDETKPGDVLATVPPLPFRSGSVNEVYLGHVLEHMPRPAGLGMLDECRRVLEPGGRLTVVVPDSRVVFGAYLIGAVENTELNDFWIYSYVQESQHRWSYDVEALRRTLLEAGFSQVRRVNRFLEPRLLGSAWWQCGVSAVKA